MAEKRTNDEPDNTPPHPCSTPPRGPDGARPDREQRRAPTSDRFYGPIGLTDSLDYQVDPEQARREHEAARRRREETATRPFYPERVMGCMLAGAVGDALGAGIEFSSIGQIRDRFGPTGLTGYAPAYGRTGAITDDTQMTLFTLEGLIRAHIAARTTGADNIAHAVHQAYLRWLHTQGEDVPPAVLTGWLLDERELHQQRAPGTTCLSALCAAAHAQPPRPPDHPINDSKGCGAVMRAAPVALWPTDVPAQTFQLAAEIGALTHGHPSGYLPAAALAVIVRQLLRGHDLRTAVAQANSELERARAGQETLTALRAGWRLAISDTPRTPETIAEQLGGGWTGEQALAIAVYAAFSAANLEHGLLLAVNHSGDSDSTGAIAGNILGALHGTSAIPSRWLDQLELGPTIEQLTNDALVEFSDHPPTHQSWRDRYPPPSD